MNLRNVILLSLFVILPFLSGCSFLCKIGIDAACGDDPSPSPTPPTPPAYTGLRVVGGDLYYRTNKIYLAGYGDYGIIGARASDFYPTDDSIRNYLNILSNYHVNLTRNFVCAAGRFGPYKAVGNYDFILTKERAEDYYNNPNAHQWNDEYWRRIRMLVDEHHKRTMFAVLTIWDHWHMYRGHNYTFPGTTNTYWDFCPYNPGGHFQCKRNGMLNDPPPRCEDLVPCSEFLYCSQNKWPPAPNDNLIFNSGAFYNSFEGRRKIMADFIAKLMATISGYDNVIIELMNEPRDGSHDQIMLWHSWASAEIRKHDKNVIVTSSPDHNSSVVDMFRQPWMDMAMFHGLGQANCNGSDVGPYPGITKPQLMDDDGCWASAKYRKPSGEVVTTTRDDPNFVRAAVTKAKSQGLHYNTKQSYKPGNLNMAVLTVISQVVSGEVPSGIVPMMPFKGWEYESIIPNEAEEE